MPYAIRHRRTGKFLPQALGRGSTWWDPDQWPQTDRPRLFAEERHAKLCVTAWVKGPTRLTWRSAGFVYDEEADLTSQDVGRSRDDLEIIHVTLTYHTIPTQQELSL